MKTLDELRKEFEGVGEIKLVITRYGISFENNLYSSPFSHINEWMNGAWFMFQELNKNANE